MSDQSFKQKFIAEFGPLAGDIAQRTGLDPSLVLGQIANESDWGRHFIGNNPFGISPGGHVASYPSVPAAAQAYVDLMNSRYRNAEQAQGMDRQAYLISQDGYGPDRYYGNRIADTARSVIAAGYKPPTASGDLSDAQNQEFNAAWQQMTGTSPPVPNEPVKNHLPVEVSGNASDQQFNVLFQQMTGMDANQWLKGTPAQTQTVQTSDGEAQASPVQDAGSAPGAATSPSQEPGMLQSLGAGVKQGVIDVGNTFAPYLAAGVHALASNPLVAAVDRAVPALGQLDQQYGQNQQPRIAAENQAYNATYGGSIPAMIGRGVGEMLPTLPVGGAIGAAGDAAVGMTANPLLQAGIYASTGAAQGAAGAAMTGQNPLTGAAFGAAMPVLGMGAGAAAHAMAPGHPLSNFLNSKLAGGLTAYLGMHFGIHGGDAMDILSVLTGRDLGHSINQIAAKYGSKVADAVAEFINKGNIAGAPAVVGAAGANVADKQFKPIAGQ